jgi:hypothetical protein
MKSKRKRRERERGVIRRKNERSMKEETILLKRRET